jgi:hypothetical protein
MICFQLSNGMKAYVDDDRADLARLKWFADRHSNSLIYARRNKRLEDGRWVLVRLHREVMGYGPGDPMLDHIDGDGLNCQRSNLRDTVPGPNQRNRSGPQRNSSIGVLGVSFDKSRKKYIAQINLNGKCRLRKRFNTLEEAIEARRQAEIKLWGIEPRRAKDLA